MTAGTPELDIEGARVWPLQMNCDDRGHFTEAFRYEWHTGVSPVQWNLLRSTPGTLRGMHVHHMHEDYQVLVEGSALIALRDLRESSPTRGVSTMFEMSADKLAGVIVPRGVLHGFYFREPGTFMVGVTCYFDRGDDLECRWDDPALEFDWPETPRHLSERDANAPGLEALLEDLVPYQPF